jgi:protein-L-isoaspartate(D-aspartate) O-methyltransferase
LIQEIKAMVEKLGTGDGDMTIDPGVVEAIRSVPREKFVPDREKPEAYANHPLPIGHGQTISQPLIVALMTHHLRLTHDHRVLEIGTGSGYQTAVLAEIASDITTIETVAPLAEMAKSTLGRLAYRHVRFIKGDGRMGSPEHAPFDRIIVTAAAEMLPEALLDQLAPDGRLVAPIGPSGRQQMILISRSRDGGICRKVLFPCAFVPLI